MYVISVSKAYTHRGYHRHRKNTKKYWVVYFLDDEGKMHSKRVSFVEALIYKALKVHRYKYACINCDQVFLGLVKSKKMKLECPYCNQ